MTPGELNAVIEAVARLDVGWLWRCPNGEVVEFARVPVGANAAEKIVTAAAPLIETAVRALVVAEIEAERDIDRAECEPGVCEFADEGDCHNDGRYTGFSLAAHVARGPR